MTEKIKTMGEVAAFQHEIKQKKALAAFGRAVLDELEHVRDTVGPSVNSSMVYLIFHDKVKELAQFYELSLRTELAGIKKP